MTTTFHANGKLLLTGEYFVLDGALALALPAKFGQSLAVEKNPELTNELTWKSLDRNGNTWFEVAFTLPDLSLKNSSDSQVANTLHQILSAAREQNSTFLEGSQEGILVKTELGFPRDWGLGTSSTLIANIAKWASVDPFMLLFRSMGGSGYDIACANAKGPVFYQLSDDGIPLVQDAGFAPNFKEQLHFVYLGQKQNSRTAINQYRAQTALQDLSKNIERITEISRAINRITNDFPLFCELLEEHEEVVSAQTQLVKVKTERFPDFRGVVKSLGAWGGDFVLVASDEPGVYVKEYFLGKGLNTILGYEEMVL